MQDSDWLNFSYLLVGCHALHDPPPAHADLQHGAPAVPVLEDVLLGDAHAGACCPWALASGVRGGGHVAGHLQQHE